MSDVFATPADFLVRGLGLPALAAEPQVVPAGTECAITGEPIEVGYPVAEMVTSATAEFLDCFRGGVDGYVSEAAARCFKNADPKKGNPTARSFLIFEDGTAYLPLINRQAATEQGRPCWSQLVREVWPSRAGQRCLSILTTDTKKRLWIRARIGQLGERTPILVYNSESAQNAVVFVNWCVLEMSLDIVEEVYAAGFVKASIASSLFRQWKMVELNGMEAVSAWERDLGVVRGMDEFPIALLMAQRPDKEEDTYVQHDLGLS